MNDAPHGASAPGNSLPPDEPLEAEWFSPSRGRRWLSRLVGTALVLLMIGLVVGPIAYQQLPQEITRWHLAAAQERRLNGDLDAALRSLDRLLEETPRNVDLLRTRADWRMQNRQYSAALRDADRALELQPHDPRTLIVRSQIYQYLGRHLEAIADWNKLVELSESGLALPLSIALNGRAYARALGGVELKEALQDVDAALEIEGENAEMLDTRGFIRHLMGDAPSALADLDRAVALIEAQHDKLDSEVSGGRLGAVDLREHELRLQQSAKGVAVLRYHRALVYEQLGKQDLADQDRQRVQQLGFAPGPELF